MGHCIKHKTLTLLLSILLTSCDLIEFHPYDIRKDSGEHNLNRLNIDRIEAADDGKDTLRFAFVTDTQRFYDETDAFVKHVNQREDVDFVIHGGDITDFGLTKEYLWIHDILKKLKVPYVAVIGNHDIVGHGKEVYKNIYGDLNFTFKFRSTRFVCLNTNALEFDYSTPVPDFDFMSVFVEDTVGIKRTVVVMHAPPYDVQFNNNAVRTFNNIIEDYKQPLFCVHGHFHRWEENDFFQNGIKYIAGDDASGRSYLLFTITRNTYSYDLVYF